MRLYNSLTKNYEILKPLVEGQIKMYVCGITPYDTTHLGHAFTYMFFDALQRVLEYQGYKVEYVQNVTDIDDDILKKAKEVKKDWVELGDFWTGKFLNDLKALNIKIPTHYVKATNSVDKIIEIIKRLLDLGLAYQKGDHVYFNVGKFSLYGKLSQLSLEQMISLSKERGADPNDPQKINPLDFILWQESLPDEPFWDSPFSKGRPGWHIECSAMILKHLGDQIDIHGGGKDLIYPHHESEIAQSESFTQKIPFVQTWMHTAMVMYQGEKMSKSLGNLVMVSDLLKKYSSNHIRFLLLSHHYREVWEFDEDQLHVVGKKISKILSSLNKKAEVPKTTIEFDRFLKALDDDMDTPKALLILQEMSENNDANLSRGLGILGFQI